MVTGFHHNFETSRRYNDNGRRGDKLKVFANPRLVLLVLVVVVGPPGTGEKKQVGATWGDKEAVSEEATFNKQASSVG